MSDTLLARLAAANLHYSAFGELLGSSPPLPQLRDGNSYYGLYNKLVEGSDLLLVGRKGKDIMLGDAQYHNGNKGHLFSDNDSKDKGEDDAGGEGEDGFGGEGEDDFSGKNKYGFDRESEDASGKEDKDDTGEEVEDNVSGEVEDNNSTENKNDDIRQGKNNTGGNGKILNVKSTAGDNDESSN